jgi:transketolase
VITLHEGLKAYEELQKEGIPIRVIDLYSVKPIDSAALVEAGKITRSIVTVEDHFAEGGLGEAVKSALAMHPIPIHTLAVRKIPKSGKPD